MLLLVFIRVAECPPVWEIAAHSVSCACLSRTSICMCSSFPFGFEGGMYDLVA